MFGGIAALKPREMFLAITPDAQFQPIRQRIHNRDANAMQPARDLVRVLVEFAAGVKLGHDDLGR